MNADQNTRPVTRYVRHTVHVPEGTDAHIRRISAETGVAFSIVSTAVMNVGLREEHAADLEAAIASAAEDRHLARVHRGVVGMAARYGLEDKS